MSLVRVVPREHERTPPTGFVVLACLVGHLACTAANPEFMPDDVLDGAHQDRVEDARVLPEPPRDAAPAPTDLGTSAPADAKADRPVSSDAAPDAGPKPVGVDVTTGLIGFWKFDETSGTTAAD